MVYQSSNFSYKFISVHGELVDKVMPGDRVAVTGVFRAVPHRANPKTRNLMSVYKTHIDVVHFSKMESDRLRNADDNQIKLGTGIFVSAQF